MTNLLSLQCPTCGARMPVAGDLNRFACEHCGNQYLLDRRLEELDRSEREHLRPAVTYTQQIRQWLQVADYEVFVHSLSEEAASPHRLLYVEIGYRNTASGPLTCRHDQWIVFDQHGYTYEPVRDFDQPEIYAGRARPYLGLSRTITPGMQLRGWLAFRLPASAAVDYLQFSGGSPARTVEFRVSPGPR